MMNADPRGGLGPKVSAIKLRNICGDYFPCLKGFKPFLNQNNINYMSFGPLGVFW